MWRNDILGLGALRKKPRVLKIPATNLIGTDRQVSALLRDHLAHAVQAYAPSWPFVVAHCARLMAQLSECLEFLPLHVTNAARGQPWGTLVRGEDAAADIFAVLWRAQSLVDVS